MKPTFALAIPHTPWIPERASSLMRLTAALGKGANYMRLFTEKEPNWSWSEKLWEWAAGTDATHLVQLQDDVIPAPNFWAALHAMVEIQHDSIIGLQGAHPKFRKLAEQDHRWARSNGWLVGVGYVIPREHLLELVRYRKDSNERARLTNEDDFIGSFCRDLGYEVWHPIPTLIQHDTTIPSTYGNDKHVHRTATVTWREYGRDEIERVEFWRAAVAPPLVTDPHSRLCWMCENEPGVVGFSQTNALIGRQCTAAAVAGALGLVKQA